MSAQIESPASTAASSTRVNGNRKNSSRSNSAERKPLHFATENPIKWGSTPNLADKCIFGVKSNTSSFNSERFKDGSDITVVQSLKQSYEMLCETPVFASLKFDGTNLGKDIDGKLYGRNLMVKEDADTYQDVPVRGEKGWKVEHIDVRLLAAELLRLKTIRRGGVNVIAFGELLCNQHLYDYAKENMAGQWYIFAVVVTFVGANDERTQAKGYSASDVDEIAMNLRSDGHLVKVHEPIDAETEKALVAEKREGKGNVNNPDRLSNVVVDCSEREYTYRITLYNSPALAYFLYSLGLADSQYPGQMWSGPNGWLREMYKMDRNIGLALPKGAKPDALTRDNNSSVTVPFQGSHYSSVSAFLNDNAIFSTLTSGRTEGFVLNQLSSKSVSMKHGLEVDEAISFKFKSGFEYQPGAKARVAAAIDSYAAASRGESVFLGRVPGSAGKLVEVFASTGPNSIDGVRDGSEAAPELNRMYWALKPVIEKIKAVLDVDQRVITVPKSKEGGGVDGEFELEETIEKFDPTASTEEAERNKRATEHRRAALSRKKEAEKQAELARVMAGAVKCRVKPQYACDVKAQGNFRKGYAMAVASARTKFDRAEVYYKAGTGSASATAPADKGADTDYELGFAAYLSLIADELTNSGDVPTVKEGGFIFEAVGSFDNTPEGTGSETRKGCNSFEELENLLLQEAHVAEVRSFLRKQFEKWLAAQTNN